MSHKRFYALLAITFAAAAMRLIPHPPNLTPIAAMALFGGAYFTSRRAAFAVPLVAMFLSDLALGLTLYGFAIFPPMPFVYASFALIVTLGRIIRHRRRPLAIGAAALSGSLLFFLVTNFGVWIHGHLYPRTITGLLACYVAAIPFFRNTVLGDALYSLVLFGGFALSQRLFPVLRDVRSRTLLGTVHRHRLQSPSNAGKL